MDEKFNQRKYKIGIYVRESRDDNEENYETIETQRDLLVNFVNNKDIGQIVSIYIDDNVSGSEFERKGLSTLKSDIIKSNVDMIVIKDLSRLGRNNAKTLQFLDFLEEYDIRVITYDGRYDSLKDNDSVGIETWFNERYIKDISRKIRANIRFKISKGEYIGHAPFGYIKSTLEKNRLCIDENTAPIVREIYKLYKEGYGYSCIAKLLNQKGYPSPAAKKHISNVKGADGISCLWNAVAIQRILCSRVYIGDTVQGVSEKVSFKSKKTRRLPLSSWVITQNTHQPIISKDEFEEVQRIRAGKRLSIGPHKGTIHLLKGLLYCGDCQSIMFARERKNRPMGYICGRYVREGKQACTSHHVNESSISMILQQDILSLLSKGNIRNIICDRLNKEYINKTDWKNQEARLEQQISAKKKHQEAIYTDKLEGRISEDLFIRMNSSLESKIAAIYKEIEVIREKQVNRIKGEDLYNEAYESIIASGLTNEILRMIIDKIIVSDASGEIDEDNKKTVIITIYYKFNIHE